MARDFEDHCWKDIVDEEILEIYQPYRREVRVGRNPAVLAIDLYNKAYQGGNRPVREVNRRYSRLLRRERLEGDRADAGAARRRAQGRPAGDLHDAPRRYRRRALDQPPHGQGGGGALPHQGRARAAAGRDRDLQGARLGFFGTPLIAHLRKVGADSLIIFGESTSGCVRASTVDAYSYGFHNVVVEECTYDRSMLSHKVNLFDLHHKYADVMHVDEVIEHLDGLARGRNAA